MGDEDNEDSKESLKKDAKELKSVFTDFAKEVGDALATWGDVSKIQTIMEQVDNQTSTIVKNFGLTRDNIVNLKSAMTDAVTQVTLLGGSFDDIVEIQKGVGQALGRNVILATEAYEKMFAAESVTGIKASEFVGKMKDVGISTYQASKEMEKVVNSAREMGVNVQAVSKEVMVNMDKLNRYNFQGGVEGLAKMASHAAAINMDMSSTFTFAEKVFDPEGAIEQAAALQRLGVTQSALLDPLKLMDLSMNDPAELQKQMADMAKGFVELNEKGQFQIAPGQIRRLREIESQMGLAQGSLAKMAIGAKELDDKMQKIKFPDAIKEEDRQFIANMAEMNERGEYVIQYKGEAREVNDLLKEFGGDKQALDQFLKDNQPKSMEEIAKEQLSTQEAFLKTLEAIKDRTGFAVAGSEVGEAQLDLVRKGYDTLAQSFKGLDTEGMRKQYDTGMKGILESMTKTLKGEGSVEDVFKSLGEAAKGTQEFLTTGVKEGLESIIKSGKSFETSGNAIIQMLDAGAKKVLELGKKAEGFDENEDTVPNTNNTPMDNRVNEVVTNANTTTQNNNPINNQNLNSESKIQMSITLDAPAHIDTAQLTKVLNDPMFQQELVKAIKNANTNNGQTMYGNPNEKK